MQLYSWNDTIVALATPPGIGALGIIRLSGPEAIKIANDLFISKNLQLAKSHTLHVGWLEHHRQRLDEVVVSLFKAPKSYTGEDVVEISCHGSPYIQQQVISACIQLGARVAKPGEFTQRAFLSGKLDLAQAEAVADVIASNTAASHQTALSQMRGGFSTLLQHLRDELIKFSALIELELDFATEDVEFADRTAFYALLSTMKQTINGLLQSFSLGNVIKNGVQVAIIGKPNAGKSTLLNTLLNENRAIVSDIAGTTRDTVEEILNIHGILFRLIDTAGIRDSTDIIENLGVEKSREKMRIADVVIYLFDINTETPEALQTSLSLLKHQCNQYLLVANKTDLINEAIAAEKYENADILFIAAKNHAHIDELKNALVNKVTNGNINTENTIITNARHYAALNEVAKSLSEIESGLQQNIPSDLVALDIRRCLHFLGTITGTITHEDQLDYIFSKFCIGK
ncbi:tRNA uridine-5-carboxymethylaminomethyl(34) synthesis GTPase MnmE [soil metagenome]